MKVFKSILFMSFFIVIIGLITTKVECQNSQIKFKKITDHLYAIYTTHTTPPYLGNVSFLVTEEGVLVVDSGNSPELGEEIVARIREITDKPIKYLIITHYHADHVLGAQSFPETTTIISHINTREYIEKLVALRVQKYIQKTGPERIKELKQKVKKLQEQKNPELEKAQKELEETRKSFEEYRQTKVALPSFAFRKKSVIHLGGKTIELLYMGPGHTGGDILVYFPEEKVIHTGDILFTVNWLPGLCPYTGGSAKNMIRILNKIEKMDILTVIPGHGAIINKAGYQKAIQMPIAYLTDLYTEVEKYVREGASLEETKKNLTLPKYQKIGTYKEFLPLHIEAVYKEITAKKKSR